MTTIGEPRVFQREEQPYLGIRVQTPMKGMSKVIDRLFNELDAWVKGQAIEISGPPFLRYHVIDMAGEMDIEAAIPVTAAALPAGLPANSQVRLGLLPAGRYASLVYSGSGLVGNKALIEWVRANGLTFDRWDDSKGDGFRSRYEAFHTDPNIEPRKTKWKIEVAIKLADEQV